MISISGNRNILTVSLVCLLLAGCLPRPAVLSPSVPVQSLPKGFFKQLPQVMKLDFKKIDSNATVVADDNVLAAVFTEKYIEKDNLLTFSILGEKSNYPSVNYDDMTGASQQLMLFHIQTAPFKKDAVVYLAARYNEDGVCIGVGPGYLGYVDNAEGHIDFLYSLNVQTKNGDTCLVTDKNLSKLSKIHAQHGFATRIVFLSEDLVQKKPETDESYWKRLGKEGIRVSKIIEYDANKVGGKQPVIFTIKEIMKDEQSLPFLPQKFDQ